MAVRFAEYRLRFVRRHVQPPRFQPPIVRRLQPHAPGLVYALLLGLVAVAAMNNQNNLLFWVFGVMLAALLISAILSWSMLRGVQIRRIDPQHGTVDQPLVVRYAVINRSRWLPVFDLRIEESKPRRSEYSRGWKSIIEPASAWVMHVAPRETVHGEAVFWPAARGEVVFSSVRLSTTFPFGIIRKSRRFIQSQHTLVFPRVFELRRHVLASITMSGMLGAKISHHPGPGDDYYGTREYRPGDSMRHIAWKRSARTGELITVERTNPSPAKLRVVLDLTSPTASIQVADHQAARELEERAISLAASLIHAAEREGYEVGLTVMGSDMTPIAPRKSQWHVRKLMAALASIDLDGPRSAVMPGPVRDAERAGLVVVMPDRIATLPGRESAMYLSARQMASLVAEVPAGRRSESAVAEHERAVGAAA